MEQERGDQAHGVQKGVNTEKSTVSMLGSPGDDAIYGKNGHWYTTKMKLNQEYTKRMKREVIRVGYTKSMVT